MYDPDQVNYLCDAVQKQRLALLDPNNHTKAVWKTEEAPRDVCKKYHIQNWNRRFSPVDGTTLLVNIHLTTHYKRVIGTNYEKEMVVCPAMQYAYPQPAIKGMLQYSIMDSCYFAPSDVTVDRKDAARPSRLANIFEKDPDDASMVYYLGIDDEILFTPKMAR